ncbi:endonuclease domain-containing protein [Ramlibacter alkalitolerans]|uniref:Endonuclease domain-containing protein n=1 Tax=Ramlibacter alkalitolerans TaxID=2039631 RepID=A0ABS1JHZ2_9BURK|nr:endonuclease domain-containing protein [Ramlibacter alkalitolerans]MBL0423812.1 endonuclease domain-containing protein [Ramlibacter alkalitolerans]
MKHEAPPLPSSLSRLRERAGVRARELRKDATDAEALLWYRLRNRQLLDLKFRRQRPIGNYIADFACLEIGLVVELDGGQHAEQLAYDAQRQNDMQALGFRTLRFWNHEVLTETDAVMEKIRQVAETLTLTPTLSRKREREQDKGNSQP